MEEPTNLLEQDNYKQTLDLVTKETPKPNVATLTRVGVDFPLKQVKKNVKKIQPSVNVSVNNIFVTYNNFYSQNKLYNIFKRVDKNNDGYLNEDEYAEFLKELSMRGDAYSLTR